jgi:hypothetical protein
MANEASKSVHNKLRTSLISYLCQYHRPWMPTVTEGGSKAVEATGVSSQPDVLPGFRSVCRFCNLLRCGRQLVDPESKNYGNHENVPALPGYTLNYTQKPTSI